MSDADFSFDEPSGGTAGDAIDPAGVGIAPDAPTRTRKPRADAGKPRGPRGRAKAQTTTKVDLSSLAGLFVGAHVQLAMATQTPELVITDDEGKQFLNSAQDVLRHYSVETTQKTIDWIAFMGSFGMMYGTRYIAVTQRHKRERTERGEGPKGQVIRPLRFNSDRQRQRAAAHDPAPPGDVMHGPMIIEPQIDGDDDHGVNG